MNQPSKACPRCQAIAHIEAPKCLSCGREYVARFVLPDPPPSRAPRPSPQPPPRQSFSPAPDIPQNHIDGGGKGIPLAQVVSTATVISGRDLYSKPESKQTTLMDDPKLVKRLLAAAGALTIALAAIVLFIVTRYPGNAKHDVQAIDAGDTALSTGSIATKWDAALRKSDPQLRPGVPISTPQAVPVVPPMAGPTAAPSTDVGPLDMRTATEAPATQLPVIDLRTPSQPANGKVKP